MSGVISTTEVHRHWVLHEDLVDSIMTSNLARVYA